MLSMKNVKLLFSTLLLICTVFLTSCDKENEVVDTENFVDSSIERLQAKAFGKKTCLELIFPVSVNFIDGSTVEADSYESLREEIINWFTTNEVEKTKENKPTLVYPIQVLNEEGEIIDVASQEELKELRSECPKFGKGKGFSCFDLVFPIQVDLGGEINAFEDKESLKEAVKTYKMEAGDNAERPSLVFPITIEYEDGTTASIESKEELKAAKQACRDDEG